MPQREFEITIAADGNVEVHIKGYKGKGCTSAMKLFQDIVGRVQSQQHTSEYYEPEEQVRYDVKQRNL